MEECEANFLKAQEPAVSRGMPNNREVANCVVPQGDWMFNTVTGGDWLPAGTTVCLDNDEYVFENGGKRYASCVHYGQQQAACTNGDLYCPGKDRANLGFDGNQRTALQEALKRNNMRHANCPTATCVGLNSYWMTQFTADNDRAVTQQMADNLCVENSVMQYVEKDYTYSTCVAFDVSSNAGITNCDTTKAICTGQDGNGRFNWGWPKQQVNAISVALLEGNNFNHPQCPTSIC